MKGNPSDTAKAFLSRLRRDQVAALGGSDVTAPAVTPSDIQFLSARIADDQRFNNLLLVSAFILLFAIFVLAASLTWHYRDQPKQITICFGGSFFTLTLLVRWLRQLWIDKNFIDLMRNAVSQLAPLEAAKLISTYYGLMLRGDKKK